MLSFVCLIHNFHVYYRLNSLIFIMKTNTLLEPKQPHLRVLSTINSRVTVYRWLSTAPSTFPWTTISESPYRHRHKNNRTRSLLQENSKPGKFVFPKLSSYECPLEWWPCASLLPHSPTDAEIIVPARINEGSPARSTKCPVRRLKNLFPPNRPRKRE